MVQSLTVVGGNFTPPGTTVGLVTTPSMGFTSAFNTSLQTLLTSISGAASLGSVNFENIDLATVSGNVSPTQGVYSTGLLDLSNTNPDGSTVAGTANASLTIPAGYNTLFVQAPGTETVAGNGSSNFLAVFGDNSSVNFNTGGGSGTVAASGHDNVNLGGGTWSFVGGTGGYNAVVSSATYAAITLAGANNLVGSYSPTLSVLDNGTNDFIVTGGAVNTVTVSGTASVEDIGAADTIYAVGAGVVQPAFGDQGGTIVFINQSSDASTITARLNPSTGLISSPGSVTVSGGAGGGVYDGGVDGTNSLVGGSGNVTLYAAGRTNYLFANGQNNFLNSDSGSNDTLIAGSNSSTNAFSMGTGTDIVSTDGSGAQTFFIGIGGSETLTGSTVPGSTNTYYFDQSASTGGGTDVITNFASSLTSSTAYINIFGQTTPAVTISGIGSILGGSGPSAGTEIALSNGTVIKLLGVNAATFTQASVGGTSF